MWQKSYNTRYPTPASLRLTLDSSLMILTIFDKKKLEFKYKTGDERK